MSSDPFHLSPEDFRSLGIDPASCAPAVLIAARDVAELIRSRIEPLSPSRAFVAGAKWWEYESRGATMWASDVDKAEAEAVRRYESFGQPEPTP